MNTFVPYEDFKMCVKVIDDKRLNKQVLEAWQLINGQWPNHPASKMWRSNIVALKQYFNFALDEWKARGKNHKFEPFVIDEAVFWPAWTGNKIIHTSHRVNLLRKNFEWYSQFGWDEISNLQDYPEGYYWPVGPLGKRGQMHSDNWLKFYNGG